MKLTPEIAAQFLMHRHLASGRLLALVPLTLGRVRICIGPEDGHSYEESW